MLLDIHTHRNAAVPGECIFNVEPAWFEPVEGCYYSVGIHPWKVLEAGPEDWTTLEKAVCHPSVPVSYTHLDVYKRQMLIFAAVKNSGEI